MKENFHYNVIFKPEPEGGFTVITPSLPGCVSYGKNLKEAKKMIADVTVPEDIKSVPTKQEDL